MKPRLSPSYLGNLFSSASYDALTELLALLEGCDAYDRERPDYGLSVSLFVFAESLLWFAQSTRSGMATYFEVASPERQELMAKALLEFAPPDFAATYSTGRICWMDPNSIAALDSWAEQNDDRNNDWLAALLQRDRKAFEAAVLDP
jgi:hypothetical protein